MCVIVISKVISMIYVNVIPRMDDGVDVFFTLSNGTDVQDNYEITQGQMYKGMK